HPGARVRHLARRERGGHRLLHAHDEHALEGKGQDIPRTSHSPSVPRRDIISAPPSAHLKPSILSESLSASVILRRIAFTIQRVTNASSRPMPSVPIASTTKRSQPSRKFSTPKMAATTKALPSDFTWKPGRTIAVIHTARDRMIQERMRPMVTSWLGERAGNLGPRIMARALARRKREPGRCARLNRP